MNCHLFVYGTLLTRAVGLGESERARFAREARSLGPAATPGYLYDLGDYPGLLPSDTRALVKGEVFELSDPGACFSWLDLYEDTENGGTDGGGEFERIERPVTLAGSRALTAWVYAYGGDVSRARLIVSGDWQIP